MALSFFATCPKGLESLLLNELIDLGAKDAKETVAGVSFKGDFTTGMRTCLWSRFASRILLELSEFFCETDTELYIGANGVAWEKYFDKSNTISVSFSGTNSSIRNTQYGALKVKDAICDRMQKTLGGRPDVDRDNPDVVINCHLDKKGSANILLDLSGKALLKREYHRGTGAAPLKENLAAAMIKRSGYNNENFLDPMCGSGTLLFEAASFATDTAPGLRREHFGFFALKQFDNEVWLNLVEEASERSRKGIEAAVRKGIQIIGFDLDDRIVTIANENAQKAGFADLVKVFHSNVQNLYNPFTNENKITIVTNPPYGKRMGNFNELISLYTQIGAGFKHYFKGARAAVISTSAELLSCMRLHADKIYKLYNGELECQLRVFDINETETLTVKEEKNLAIATDFSNRLKKNLAYMQKWAKNVNTNAYRVYDADVPEYAAAIDYYNGYYVIQAYKAPAKVNPRVAKRHELDMLSATVEVAGVSGDKVILKSREVMSGDRQYEKSEELRNEFITVNEDNALFKVNLYDYLDTGLFLDGRLIRKLIREKSQGKSVLNLFAYTCSASVAAALGGATRVVSVDMSKTYLNWGMDNFKLNSLSLDNTDFIQADCLAWLSKDQEEKFDLIYIDPPTFSNSKRMESSFDVKRDHVQLLANLTRHLKDGGEVIFCNNMRGFVLDESISEYGFSFENISEKTLPRDFARDKKIHTCYRLVFTKADMVKHPEPMTSGKAAPKWQKSLSAKSDTYHDYTDRNDYEESVRETLTNKVWGNAKASTSSYKTQKQGRFTRSDSEFNSDSPRRNRFEDGKSGRFSRDRKENNRGFGSKSRTAKRKPRVFGPDGIKDL
ncbi:bifunctional 23S rRNA (guanine(2069)-N(7))-methyltransferase RlmK/23S rRNA (guanine(2445)-N(2))-methyltransferase RlmL [Succinivibrio dextrinosolvens]|uniref:bifunctional 23S rRNA (guanine(2069)-N(7))-methyltransferase RlmK/23S rRNA (guanine(2445)-N(2))-methyltransferase RlmL n=1 Tax=Succinivibrio dextrinosolvens TaxID=83771 RepID=UPI0004E22131